MLIDCNTLTQIERGILETLVKRGKPFAHAGAGNVHPANAAVRHLGSIVA